MDADLENKVKRCVICWKKPPKKPWSPIHVITLDQF